MINQENLVITYNSQIIINKLKVFNMQFLKKYHNKNKFVLHHNYRNYINKIIKIKFHNLKNFSLLQIIVQLKYKQNKINNLHHKVLI